MPSLSVYFSCIDNGTVGKPERIRILVLFTVNPQLCAELTNTSLHGDHQQVKNLPFWPVGSVS